MPVTRSLELIECPLCHETVSDVFLQTADGLRYFLCQRCDLRFMDPAQRLSNEEERTQYLQHNNDVTDPRYQGFVRPLYQEIRSRANMGSLGLDYGAGTGPVLSEMLEADSYVINRYDPYFWPDTSVFNHTYDFICSSEVVEHFYSPSDEFQRLRSLLRPGGFLAIMTLLYQPGSDFGKWHYRRDPTHVVFYTPKTFQWIANRMNFKSVTFIGERIIVLTARR